MEKINLHLAQRDEYPELSRWIVTLSADPAQHCLHSWAGGDADNLCQQLLSYLDDGELKYIVAYQGRRLVGAIGCEYDVELGRGWLHGPHTNRELWQDLALRLFERLLMEVPSSIVQWDAFLNIHNLRGRRFYTRLGFREREHLSYEYWLDSVERVSAGDRPYRFLAQQQHQSFISLYQDLFPKAYYSAERIIEMDSSSHRVFTVGEREDVSGFAVVSVDEDSSSGEIQFLGVREAQRGQGLGRDLLLMAVDWLLGSAQVSRVTLNANEELMIARRLYEQVGFRVRFTGIGLELKNARLAAANLAGRVLK